MQHRRSRSPTGPVSSRRGRQRPRIPFSTTAAPSCSGRPTSTTSGTETGPVTRRRVSCPSLPRTSGAPATHGTKLSDSAIQAIVLAAINGSDPTHQSGTLPYDAHGVYFVLTSADVSETSGFCSQYCGWHTYASTTKGGLQYAFIGNPDRCPSACEAQTTSPNGNAGAGKRMRTSAPGPSARHRPPATARGTTSSLTGPSS